MKNNTNPPFSLFREYVKQLMDYGKKFIIVGPCNATHYKEIFPYIKEDKLWLGTSHPNNFVKPNGEIQKFGNLNWYTNISHKKRNTPLDLYKRYSNEYPKYDNYDAIEVSKVCDIPMDYDGIMGVPDTFLDKYCPEQFEIVGIADRNNTSGLRTKIYTKLDSPKYNDLNRVGAFYVGTELKGTYSRIFIRKRTA